MTGIVGAEGRSRVTAIIFFGIALTSLGAPQVLLNAGAAAYLLTFHGVELLPLTYIGSAFLMIPAIWALTVAGRRTDAATILIGATIFRIAVAFGLFLAAALGHGEFVGVAAPLWVRVDMVIGLMTVWRLAGKVFDAPGDRHWLAYLAVCDPLSTVFMGFAGPLIAGVAGVAAAFAIAALTLAAACPPAVLIRAQLREEQDRVRRARRRSRPALRPLSPSMRVYLLTVIAAMAVWAVAHFQLDILLHGFAGLTFESLGGRFDFFAYTLAAAGIFGVGFTAFGQGRLLRAYGVRLLLVVLPIILIVAAGLGLAAASAFDAPVLLFAAVTAMKVVEFALVSGFYTRAWRGLLSPLPDTHRDRLIATVNRNVHAVGALGGAGVGFGLIITVGFDPEAFTIAFLALSALGLVLSYVVLRGFIAALERALARRQSIEDMELGAADRRSREVVQKMLREGAGRDAIEAARLQAALDVDGFVHMAPRLIARGDRDIVAKLLDTVREIARPELFPPMAGRLTIEEDPEVRDALMTAAAATGHPRSARLLAKSLADQPENPPMGALIGLGRHGGTFGGAVASQFLERYALKGDRQLSRALDAAREIGRNAPTGPVAVGLQSPDPATRRKAIRAAGKIGDPTLANLVVQQLSDPRERRAATLALTAIGEGAVSALASAIGDRAAPFTQRAAALRALGDIAEPEAMAQLLLHGDSRDPRAHRHRRGGGLRARLRNRRSRRAFHATRGGAARARRHRRAGGDGAAPPPRRQPRPAASRRRSSGALAVERGLAARAARRAPPILPRRAGRCGGGGSGGARPRRAGGGFARRCAAATGRASADLRDPRRRSDATAGPRRRGAVLVDLRPIARLAAGGGRRGADAGRSAPDLHHHRRWRGWGCGGDPRLRRTARTRARRLAGAYADRRALDDRLAARRVLSPPDARRAGGARRAPRGGDGSRPVSGPRDRGRGRD
ncbi:MAG: HEAT repeat domain-containing protein [Pseudomonadota bacterium]